MVSWNLYIYVTAEVGRDAKNCAQVRVLFFKNNMTQAEVNTTPPNSDFGKSKKVFCEKSTRVLSNC